jgi:hypothetical protein
MALQRLPIRFFRHVCEPALDAKVWGIGGNK